MPITSVFIDDVVEQLEMVDSMSHHFFNTATGEFGWYNEEYPSDEDDPEQFEEDEWIALPSSWDIHEYDIMARFTAGVRDARKQDSLEHALHGKGAFRRFKDTLIRTGLEQQWYDYRDQALLRIAKEWCEENDIAYTTKP